MKTLADLILDVLRTEGTLTARGIWRRIGLGAASSVDTRLRLLEREGRVVGERNGRFPTLWRLAP